MGQHVVTVQDTNITFSVHNGETILNAARKNGIWFPFECGWGSCGTCKATLVDGDVICRLPDAPALSDRDQRRRRIILCQSVPNSDVTIKTRVLESPHEHLETADYNAVVKEVKMLAKEVALFRLELNRIPSYQPGQYAIFNLGDDLRRAYSMANLPGSREVEFIARRYSNGPGSQKLFSLTKGTELTLEMPYGVTYLEETSRPIVFIAGGTGIAPILCMMRQWKLNGHAQKGECMMFYGARTPEDLVYTDELDQIMESVNGGKVIPVVNESNGDWNGEIGFVTDALSRRLEEPWDKYEFYLAGPPVMVNAVLKLFEEKEVPVTQVHYDSFG